jgi:hypothetical protein
MWFLSRQAATFSLHAYLVHQGEIEAAELAVLLTVPESQGR